MKTHEAKEKFIQTWGVLATQWGISRTMAQVHALLLVTEGSLSTEEVMERLRISRGNANMNLRALMEWGIVEKELKVGERKDFFKAEKDVWILFRQIAKERKRREIDPVLEVLDQLGQVEGDDAETMAFKSRMNDLGQVTQSIYGLADKMILTDKLGLLRKLSEWLK